MRAVIQRVTDASVKIDGKVTGKIEAGLLIFLGIGINDSEKSSQILFNKIIGLRIFPDEEGKMNRSLTETKGSLLVVSQFTLFADVTKGRRPSFMQAAAPENGEKLYKNFISLCRNSGIKTETGTFQSYMSVSLTNSGPVTIVIDTDDFLTQ